MPHPTGHTTPKMRARLEYVKALVAADKNISMGAVRKAVLKKYKVHINFKKLRAAFIDAGGKVRKIGRGASPYPPTFAKTRRRANQHDVADIFIARNAAVLTEIPIAAMGGGMRRPEP